MDKELNLQQDAVKHFGLSRDPFRGEMRGDTCHWISSGYQKMESRIINALELPGIIALTGPVGSGKSATKRHICQRLERALTFRNDAWRIIPAKSVTKRKVTASAVANMMLHALNGKTFYGDTESAAIVIEEQLERLAEDEVRAVVIVDDAHELPSDILRSMKKLYELAADCGAHLAIWLLGHPRLANRIEREEVGDLNELRQRIELVEMPKINRSLAAYLDHKFQQCGGKAALDIFAEDALQAISRLPDAQYPLSLNRVAAAAMNVATACRLPKVRADIITDVFELAQDLPKAKRALEAAG